MPVADAVQEASRDAVVDGTAGMPDGTLARMLAASAERPVAQAALARVLLAKGKMDQAERVALDVWHRAAAGSEAAVYAQEVLGERVPRWHPALVRDAVRNDAYEAALKRVVRPGMRILDIGSGTGLLAMLAARAGAAEVFTCEMNPAVARVAEEIVAANGLAGRVRVLGVHSSEIDAERDLGGRVDVIVSEIVSNQIVDEGVLPTMEHAVRDLLKPGGVMIPASGRVMVALAFDGELARHRVGWASGFDLSRFDRLTPLSYGADAMRAGIELRSSTGAMFDFDFAAAVPVREGSAAVGVTGLGGTANVVAQWIRLRMDETGVYENAPGTIEDSCWAVRLHPLPEEVRLEAGEGFVIHGSHDRQRLRVWTR